MKSLILMDADAIGDHISHALTIARKINDKSDVYLLTSNTNGYKLLKQTPYFKSCILCDNMNKIGDLTNVANSFGLYDEVFIPMKRAWDNFKDLPNITNVVKKDWIKEGYRPFKILKEYGFTDQFEVQLNIDWYKYFYEDFKCSSNTVLVNGTSHQSKRTYNNIKEVIKRLKDFDVRTIDCNKDIRTNLHLINQCKYILTTDTSTLWIAKSLNKNPYVFLCNAEFDYNLELALGVKNIINDNLCLNINDISVDQIVDGFLNKVHKIL